ncbi:hypothetical protein RI367_001371 [Sorochytrium milnesiophthora]
MQSSSRQQQQQKAFDNFAHEPDSAETLMDAGADFDAAFPRLPWLGSSQPCATAAAAATQAVAATDRWSWAHSVSCTSSSGATRQTPEQAAKRNRSARLRLELLSRHLFALHADEVTSRSASTSQSK